MEDKYQKQNQQGHREQIGGGSPDRPDRAADDRRMPQQPDDVDKRFREDQAGRQGETSSDRARDHDYGMGEEQNPTQGDGER